MANYTNFFTDTDVQTFRVPQRIIGNNQDKGMLGELSHPALRLYLVLLSLCQRKNKPIVKMSTAYIEQFALISEKKISQVREELDEAFLVRSTREKGGYLYEVLDPHSSGLPLLMPKAATKGNPLIAETGGPNLTSAQIEEVFTHYLKDSHIEDDANGMRFLCPFHVNVGKARRYHLTVGTERGGPWMCHWQECRHNGKRRPHVVPGNGWLGLSDEKVAYDGGGNVLDFIVAMVEFNTGEIIDRNDGEDIMAGILAS
jgi:hypothetical protein